ncbi:MAG: flagellar biosynthesis anti-sigma factor FlgM [Thermodesulfobacteriota bacterium]
MKISDTNLFVELKGYLKEADKASKGKEGKVGDSSSKATDTVSLSGTSKDIQKAREIVDSTADIREEKVAALKKSIDEGNYSVNGETIASNIIESALIDILL